MAESSPRHAFRSKLRQPVERRLGPELTLLFECFIVDGDDRTGCCKITVGDSRAGDHDAIFGGGRDLGDILENATSRPRVRHQIINHVIDVDGDRTTTTAYWFAMTNNATHGQIELLYMGHYEDELARIDGEWKFTRRSVYNESQQNRALFYPGLGERDPQGGAMSFCRSRAAACLGAVQRASAGAISRHVSCEVMSHRGVEPYRRLAVSRH